MADFERVKTLFFEACVLPAHEQARFVRQATKDDPAVRAQVMDLLHHDAHPLPAIDGAASGGAADMLAGALSLERDPVGSHTGVAAPLPSAISGYRILRVIGEGGMGIVYEAQQQEPFRRVAMKVMHSHIITPALLRRFHQEIQVLGHLRHPGIAQVYHAGSEMRGGVESPYFVMELIQGPPLGQYSRERPMNPRQILDLIAKVCDALHYAHTQGVIHRDLKPANILVEAPPDLALDSGADVDAQPKIVDFGVARAHDVGPANQTLHTGVGQIIGTVTYMSPEQASGTAATVDARSDVYALGVIAYELLSRRPPYAMEGKAVHECIRIICEQSPPRLGVLDRALRGDIEVIVCKALEKDPQRRYASAADMGADIRRHLGDQPIIARPPSSFYVLRKYVKRHKPVAIAVVVGAIGATLLLGALLLFNPFGDATGNHAISGASPASSLPIHKVVRATNRADEWLAMHPDAVLCTLDQFYPGVDTPGTTCLTPGDSTSPVTLRLTGGTITISAVDREGRPVCAIQDGSTPARVSDILIPARGHVTLEFDPPITAFFSMFGSLALNETVTEKLFSGHKLVDVSLSAPSVHSSYAQGHGFTSPRPIDRMEVSSSESGPVMLGSFRTMLGGEPNLGTVAMPGYGGPLGDEAYVDFACVFERQAP